MLAVVIVDNLDIGAMADPFAHVLPMPMRLGAASIEFQAAINRVLNQLQTVDDQPHLSAGAVQSIQMRRLDDLERR